MSEETNEQKYKRLLIELMIVAKTWHIVWQDKFAPMSNEAFLRIEREFLETAKKP